MHRHLLLTSLTEEGGVPGGGGGLAPFDQKMHPRPDERLYAQGVFPGNTRQKDLKMLGRWGEGLEGLEAEKCQENCSPTI